MQAAKVAVAERCHAGAYLGHLTFPQIVQALSEAGFESYMVDYRRNATTYFLGEGDSVVLDSEGTGEDVAPNFDAEGVAAQVRWAQASPPGYSYKAFCRNVKAFGCAGYLVSFPGRRVLYFGRSAETHVEHFPGS